MAGIILAQATLLPPVLAVVLEAVAMAVADRAVVQVLTVGLVVRLAMRALLGSLSVGLVVLVVVDGEHQVVLMVMVLVPVVVL